MYLEIDQKKGIHNMTTTNSKEVSAKQSKELSSMRATITAQLDNIRTETFGQLDKLKAELSQSKAELEQKKASLDKVLTLEAARKV
jgi:hypothetical protein